MGVDIEALKKGVNDLAMRVEALEKRKLPVDIHGDLNLMLLGGYSDDGKYGIDVTGRPLGFGRDGNASHVGFTHDLSVWHEAAVTLTGTNDTGPKWRATAMIGNTTMSSFSDSFGDNSRLAFGSMSELFPGIPYGEPETDIWIQELVVMFATTLWGLAFNAEVGRVGFHLNGYTFQRPDVTPYYKQKFWDSKDWYFDGGIFRFRLGCMNWTMFGGRQSNRLTSDGVELNPMFAGQFGHVYDPETFGIDERPRGFAQNNGIFVDQHLGFNIEVPLTDRGKVNLNYVFLDSNSTTFLGNSLFANRAIVYGGDLEFKLNNQIMINAGYSQSNLQDDGDNVVEDDNTAFWARLSYQANRWGGFIGYRSIDPQFAAPGSWGRIGIWWNPVDIEGVMAGLNFNLTDRLGLMAHGGFYRGKDVTLNGVTGLTEDDKVNHINIRLNYKMNESWDFMLSGEMVNWDLADRGIPADGGFTGGEPSERWWTLGLRYNMSDNAWMSFWWQMSDYDSDNVSGFNPFSGFSDTKAQGGMIGTQIGIKF